MGKVGMPILLLKQGNGKTKRSGNAKAVALEALEERYSSDPDLDRTRTKYNVYLKGGFRSGIALSEYWRKEAEAFRVIDKNGNKKKLRSDASIGFANILKPDKEFMDGMKYQEQTKFLNDLATITIQEYKNRGIQIDAAVVHFDEANPHVHLFGHDAQYKLGKKLNLKFFNVLNREVPKQLRALGWDIQDCSAYDVAAVKEMSPDERAEYKEKHIARKKSNRNNRPSEQYKREREQEREQEMNEREKRLNALESYLIQKQAQLHIEVENRVKEALKPMIDDLESREKNIKEIENKFLGILSDAEIALANANGAYNSIISDVNVSKKRKEIDQRILEQATKRVNDVRQSIPKTVPERKEKDYQLSL